MKRFTFSRTVASLAALGLGDARRFHRTGRWWRQCRRCHRRRGRRGRCGLAAAGDRSRTDPDGPVCGRDRYRIAGHGSATVRREWAPALETLNMARRSATFSCKRGAIRPTDHPE